MMILNALSIATVFPLAALAAPTDVPRDLRVLPRTAKKLAFDEVNKRILAFDHEGRSLGAYAMNHTTSHLSSRASGSCTPMVNDDIEKIPGIDKIRDEADKNWGTGSRNEVVNDEDLPENPANICTYSLSAPIVYDGKPSCTKISNKVESKIEGSTVKLANSVDSTFTSSTQVLTQSSFSVGTKVSVTVGFPEIAEVSGEISTNAEVSNTQGTTTTSTENLGSSQGIEFPIGPDAGPDCTIALDTSVCHVQGKGTIKMASEGWIWFEYDNEVDGHYKWALSIESILPNVDDRSSPIEFQSTGTVNMQGDAKAVGCGTAHEDRPKKNTQSSQKPQSTQKAQPTHKSPSSHKDHPSHTPKDSQKPQSTQKAQPTQPSSHKAHPSHKPKDSQKPQSTQKAQPTQDSPSSHHAHPSHKAQDPQKAQSSQKAEKP